MATKNFPDVTPDVGATFALQSNTTQFRSELNGTVQHQSLPGDKWVGAVSFSNRQVSDASKVKAFLASLRGSAGRFFYSPVDSYEQGTAGGSGLVNGASQTGNTLVTDGWTANQTNLLEVGDYFEVNGELKLVIETATSDGSGNSTITFEPPLRSSPPAGDPIITTNPKAVFHLDSDSQPWDINVNGVQSVGFGFIEDII